MNLRKDRLSNTMFLTNENAQYILTFLHRFLLDKFQFKLLDVLNEGQLRKIVETEMIGIYRKNGAETPVEQLNKMVLSELKEYFKKHYRLGAAAAATVAPPAPPPPPEMEALNLSEDSDFINRVQMLELQRKTFEAVAVAAAPSTSAGMNDLEFRQEGTKVPGQVSMIYMPSPPKIGKEIYIHSWQREWIYSAARSVYTWNGPLPQMPDALARIGCWIGPTAILQKAPSLVVRIQGAGGETQDVGLIPSYTCSYYAIYKPALESLGYIRVFGLPWRITLMTTDERVIDLGMDGDQYESFEPVYMHEGHTTLGLEVAERIKHYKIGDAIRVLTHTQELSMGTVMNVNQKSIEVDQVIKSGGYVMNFSQQHSLLLEMTTTSHRPVKN